MTKPLKTIFTAQSKYFFFARMIICKFVFENGHIPLNPFNSFSYFLEDLVDRDLVRSANSRIVEIVDEVWSFGPIANGVYEELKLAMRLGKPIKFYSIGSSVDKIQSLAISELEFEDELRSAIDVQEFLRQLEYYERNLK